MGSLVKTKSFFLNVLFNPFSSFSTPFIILASSNIYIYSLHIVVGCKISWNNKMFEMLHAQMLIVLAPL